LYDVGSGLLADLSASGLTTEPSVQQAVASGADLVLFSGDKLLGGPQAGCLVGSVEALARCRSNPFARALRADKFTLAALEATLALYREPETAMAQIPVLHMLTLSAEDLHTRALAIAGACPSECRPLLSEGESAVGGGSFPGAVLPTTLVLLDAGRMGANGLALRLRLGDPPLVARVVSDKVALDPRTLPHGSESRVAEAVAQAIRE
jgi:L-seryl-tRNA(Ser) seleniumtransferase